MFEQFYAAPASQQVMVLLSILPLFVLFANNLVNIPGMIKYRTDVLSPQFAIAGCLFIGTTIRTFFLLFDPNGHDSMVTLVGYNLPEEILMPGLLAINFSIFLWMIAYSSVPKKSVARYKTKLRFDSNRYFRAQCAMVAFGSFIMLLYLLKINFFSSITSYGISGKRVLQIGTEYGNHTSFGYLRFAGDFLSACTIMHAVYYYTFRRTKQNLYILILLYFLSIIIPIVASARGEVLYLILSILVIRHYAIRRVSPTFMLGLTVAFFIILGFMGILRSQAYQGTENVQTGLFESTVSTLVYNAHFIGVGKTSVILEEMPETENYLYGKSYLTILIAPIPRVLWPDKPVVRSGRFVGTNLYKKPTYSGVPPGFIGEAYMNFGLPGILILTLLFGYACKKAYLYFVVVRNQDDAFRLGLYAIVWVTILDVSMVDFTGNVMRFMKYIIPFLLLTRFCMVPVDNPVPRSYFRKTPERKIDICL